MLAENIDQRNQRKHCKCRCYFFSFHIIPNICLCRCYYADVIQEFKRDVETVATTQVG